MAYATSNSLKFARHSAVGAYLNTGWRWLKAGVAGVLAACVAASAAHASSQSTQWNVYQAPQGALLTAHFVFSAADGSASRRLLFTGNCDPSQPIPYVVTAINRLSVDDAPATMELTFRLSDGNTLIAPANLDRVAVVNSQGDTSARYGTSFHPSSKFWATLQERRQRGPQFRGVGGYTGPSLTAALQRDRDTIATFLQACRNFMTQAGLDPNPRPTVWGCERELNDPSKTATPYPQDIVQAVCGSRRNDPRPAGCMHWVMGGNVAWNQEGNTQWNPGNAAYLCFESQNTAVTVNCFNRYIQEGRGWQEGISRCRGAS